MTSVENPPLTPEILYEKVYSKLPNKIKKKIMWGSDFFMLDLAETDLSRYLNQFEAAFGKDFERISCKNPRRFLKIKT